MLYAQPKSGDWKATTRFGQFVLTVSPDGTQITKLRTTFTNYTCGGITQNGTVTSMPSPGWPVSNRQFTIVNTIDPQGKIKLTINGTFTPSGDQVSGTWSMLVNGQTDSDSWGPAVVTFAEEARSGVPACFLLDQNYPNPFNPSTTISYELPKAATVSLKIFNALGQEVASLVNEKKEAGYYQATWNATMPSGIYFYRLQAGGSVETKKMILLR